MNGNTTKRSSKPGRAIRIGWLWGCGGAGLGEGEDGAGERGDGKGICWGTGSTVHGCSGYIGDTSGKFGLGTGCTSIGGGNSRTRGGSGCGFGFISSGNGHGTMFGSGSGMCPGGPISAPRRGPGLGRTISNGQPPGFGMFGNGSVVLGRGGVGRGTNSIIPRGVGGITPYTS